MIVAVWLFGLAALVSTGSRWPGIMFVIGLSAIVEGFVKGQGWYALQGGLWALEIGIWAIFDFSIAVLFVLLGLSVLLGAFVRPLMLKLKPHVDNSLESANPAMLEGATLRMSIPLIPQAFWFRLAVPCPRIEGLPRSGGKGRLLDLPESCRVPDLAPLEGNISWAEVRVAWNPNGLAVAVETSGKPGPIRFEERLGGGDGFQVWIDTRDTRDVARATRFCHRFSARLAPAGPRGGLVLEVEQRTIARAVADAPLCRPDLLASRAERQRDGWLAELFLPAEALHGFDPETNRKLGFAYQVTDPDREDQFLGIGRDFPVGENPSLWATLELRD